MELLKQLWLGEVPLARTYWVFGVLIGALFSIAAVTIEFNYIEIYKSFGNIPTYSLLTAQYTYFPFIYVAIWRSSNKYTGPNHWAVLAKIAVVLGVLMLISNAIKVYENLTKVTESQLLETADLLNKSLPLMVDNVTQLYRVSAEKKQLTYHYQIVGTNSSEIDPSVFYKRMRPQLVTQACAATDMKAIFQNGVAVAYSYKASNNTLIASIVVTPDDCGY